MNNINIIILLLAALFAISCSQYDAIEYENDPAIYFANEQYGQKDSIDHSFFALFDEVRDTVYLDIRTMGYPSEKDRPIKISQTNIGKTYAAVAGVHYVPFDDPEVSKYFVIPANSERVRLPIILLRDKSLDTEHIRLELSVEENEHFRPGIEKWRNFLVKTTAQAVKPSTWDSRWRYQFGASWGPEKMKFIILHTGYTDWEVIPSDPAYSQYLGQKVTNAFQQYNLENPNKPLKEADETLVSFTS